MIRWIRKSLIVVSLSAIMICGSFTNYVKAASYSTRELCEAWANHAATPWAIEELYYILINVYNMNLTGLAESILNFGISPRTKEFIEQACALDPDNEHGGHGGTWGNEHGGHGGYWNEVENSADDDNKNGNNYNYYDSDDHDTFMNYNIINNEDNSISYTYNNTNYNYYYDFSQTYYNTTNNSYTFNLTNNTQLTYINNYNNTTVIYGGDTYRLYYRLPDGSDSFNLTEEEAKNGFKTSLSVDSYENGYDSATLRFLYHFDNNEYDAAYPSNTSLSFSKNSINYVAGSTGFSYALSFEGDTAISTNTSGLYYSFRFYPLVNDQFSLTINDTDIFARESAISTTYDYVEWTQTTTGESSTDHPAGSNSFTMSVIRSTPYNTPTQLFPEVTGYSKAIPVTQQLPDGTYKYDCVYTRKAYTDTTEIEYETSQRTYNIINNRLWQDTGSDLVNYGMWNFVAIMIDGSVYINGVDSHIDIDNTDNLELSFEGDSVFYFDEFFGNTVNRSSYSPSMPYDSNIIYSLPAEFKNNCVLIKSLISVTSWKFGGYRPSNPVSGDVFIAVDQLGNVISVQQFNGIEWVEVGAGLYNEYLGLWINIIGFNIFKMNWYYQDLNFNTDQDNSNTLIKFLTQKFQEVVTAINNIKINLTSTNEGDEIVTNIQNDYDVNVENDLDLYIDHLIDANNDIDLTAPELQPDSNNLHLFAPIVSETVDIFSTNKLMFILIVPFAIGILGLIL